MAAQPRLRAEGDDEHRRVPTTRAHWRDAPSSACLRHRVGREQAVWTLAEAARPVTIDLEAQEIRFSDGRALPFDIDPHRKRTLIEGLDEIGLILADDLADIAAFEARQRQQSPWLHLTREQLGFFDDVGEELR